MILEEMNKITYYYRHKGAVTFLEGFSIGEDYFQVTRKEFSNRQLIKQLDDCFVYKATAKNFTKCSSEYTAHNCSQYLKEYIVTEFLQGTLDFNLSSDSYRTDLIEKQNTVQQTNLEEKIDHVAKLVKGLNRALLNQYCNEAFNAGYKAGYDTAVKRLTSYDFNVWFNNKMNANENNN